MTRYTDSRANVHTRTAPCAPRRHLRLVATQRRYVAAMRDLAPDRVLFVDAGDVAGTTAAVAAAARRATPEERPVALFDALVAWLRTHAAG